jgi:hypothetical protein
LILRNWLSRLFQAQTKNQDEQHSQDQALLVLERARTFPGFQSATGLFRDCGETTPHLKSGLAGGSDIG